MQSLPNEILLSIAYFVGSDHFHAHPDTLLLFKSWWHEARIVAYEELSLTLDKIEKYLEAPERIKHLVKANNTNLTVSLTGLFERNEALNDGFITSESVDRTMESLTSLAFHLKFMNRTNAFRLQLFVFLHQAHANEAGPIPTIISTLLEDLPRSLSRLTLDCYNDYHVTQGQPIEVECPAFLLSNKDFVPSLRHLRLRSRFICPKIFDTICSSGESQLETLIINISLKVEQSPPPINKVFFSKECHGEYLGHGSGDLRTKLSDTANAKLPQLTRIKALRILRHKHPSDDVISYDVLSARTVVLPKNANWEDADCHNDGETDPDCEERSENSFSSSDSDDESG